MGLKGFKYYLLLPLLSLTKSTNNKTKRRVEKNKVRNVNIKDQSIKLVQNQSEHIIFQNTKYSVALISAYNKQYKNRSNVSEQTK